MKTKTRKTGMKAGLLLMIAAAVFFADLGAVQIAYGAVGTAANRAVRSEEAADPSQPGNPADPTEPSNPTDPTNPAEPTEPTDPTKPSEPTETKPPVLQGWQEDGNYYYKDGKALVGIHKIGGVMYYFRSTEPKGKMLRKIYKSYGGLFYYFGSDGKGKPYTGTWSGSYYRNGRKFTGTHSGYYYRSGKKFTGTYSGCYYKSGKKFTGTRNGYYYKSGKKFTGVKGSNYYSGGKISRKYKNTVKKINGTVRYFHPSGKVMLGSGWKRIGSNRYYIRKGAGLTGWHYVGDYKYYFTSGGKLVQDLIGHFGSSWKKKDLKIKVNRRKNCVTIYAKDGNRGYTIPVKALICSVGKSHTPTVKGTYSIDRARTYRWHTLGSAAMGGFVYGQYCSRITGSYLFHSVTYRRPNNRTLISSAYNNLGGAASHGCVRLQVKDAKLLYDIARYRKTTVVIYDSSSVGPFDKPQIRKIPAGQNYEPTDPNL